MTSIIIATSMIVVAFDTLLLILFLYLAIAAIRLVFRKNYKGAAKLGGLVALAVVLALIGDMPNLYIFYIKPQIRNYAPNMIQKRKESASLVKRGHSASNVTIKTYKCPLPHHAT